MPQLSKKLAERFRLNLTPEWQNWFDHDFELLRPAGVFQTAISADQLCAECPAEIWPGFMLPDTLPVIGNEYGDWICVRIEADGRLGELLHWYHGGGDWVPVGASLAEAILHDVVDQFRPVGYQVLRGASETLAAHHVDQVAERFSQTKLRDWLAVGLASDGNSKNHVGQILLQIEAALRRGDYATALRSMYDAGWSLDAVACDLIEECLQRPVTPLANPAAAKSLGMNWTPDYVRWLFDAELVPTELRSQLAGLVDLTVDNWPAQDWGLATALAEGVLQRRQDLGWAFNIMGWSKQRTGDLQGAASVYFRGMFASAFSDQSVRMRTHWTDSSYGKFAMAQLFQIGEQSQLPPSASANLDVSEAKQRHQYLTMIVEAPEKLLLNQVREFWCEAGKRQLQDQAPAGAFDCFYRAGWDLGLQRLSEYQSILEMMVHSAQSAGWDARAQVAQTHLNCLRSRFA